MSALFKKPDLGSYGAILVLNAPESFEPELAALDGVTVMRSVSGSSAFAMAFRKYRCGFNRDSGWAAPGAAGLEPVRMVAIDADWSALRFPPGAIHQFDDAQSPERDLDSGKAQDRAERLAGRFRGEPRWETAAGT